MTNPTAPITPPQTAPQPLTDLEKRRREREDADLRLYSARLSRAGRRRLSRD